MTLDWLPVFVIAMIAILFLSARWFRKSLAISNSNQASQSTVDMVLRDQEQNAGAFKSVDDRFSKTVKVAQAGFDTTSFVLIIIAIGALLGLGYFVIAEELYGAIGIAVLGSVIGWIVLTIRAAYVRSKVQEQFPTVADMLSGAVRAGVSVEQAISSVASKCHGFLGSELQNCARKIDLGLPTSQAIQEIADRYELLDLRLLAAAVAVNQQTGGNLSKVMEQLARVSRERQAYRRRIGAMTASAQLAAIIVGAAAPVLVIYYVVRGKGLANFWTDSSGRFLIILAICLEILGVLWILALTRKDL